MRRIAEFTELQLTGGSMSVRFTGIQGMRRLGRRGACHAGRRGGRGVAGAGRRGRGRGGHAAPPAERAPRDLRRAGRARFATSPSATSPSSPPAATGSSAGGCRASTSPPRWTALWSMAWTYAFLACCSAPSAPSPVFGGTLDDVDETPALAMPGVKRVVRQGDCGGRARRQHLAGPQCARGAATRVERRTERASIVAVDRRRHGCSARPGRVRRGGVDGRRRRRARQGRAARRSRRTGSPIWRTRRWRR